MASANHRGTLIVAGLALCSVCLMACRGSGGHGSLIPRVEPAGPALGRPSPILHEQSLSELIAAIQAAERPTGVEPALWDQLTAELVRVIEERGTSKLALAPPSGGRDGVLDLHFDPGAASVTLAWTHVCVGDYNQDGLVSINDLTPIGQHYLAASGDLDWAEARLADGNGDGMVTINDITPIGQNYLVQAAAYNVYGSTDMADYPESPSALNGASARLIGSVDFSSATAGLGGRALFAAAVDSPVEGEYYWVRPSDGEADGSPSNLISGNTRGDWWMQGREETHGGLSLFFAPRSNNVAWTYATGDEVLSAPALRADGWIFIGSKDDSLHAVNPQGGGGWTFPTGGDVSSPAIGLDGTVYFGSSDGHLYAVNPDGSLQWSYNPSNNALYSPAIGPDGTIFAGCADDSLYALLPDMTVAWSHPTGDDVRSCPAVGPDGAVYFGSDDGNVYAVNSDGTERWTFNTGGTVTASVALAADGTVYAGSEDSLLYAIGPGGAELWRYEAGDGINAGPAIGTDGTVYFGSRARRLFAVNPDGSQRWVYRTWNDIETSPAIGADGIIYVGSQDDAVYAINPDGTLHWSYETGGGIGKGLAIGADGTLYAGSSDGNLYAFAGGEAGTPATIAAVLPHEGITGTELTLSATPAGTPPLSFSWDLGGGADPNAITGAQPTVTLADPGSYTASVTVSNGFGPADTREFELYVHAAGPPASGWVHSWGGESYDWLGAVAADSSGNLHCVGTTESYGNGPGDVLLLEYDPSGTLLTARTWGTETRESAYDMVIDSGDNIYVAGVYGEYYASDTLLLKFNAAGELQWAKAWDSGSRDEVHALALRSDGSIVMAGSTTAVASDSSGALFVFCDAAGEVVSAPTWDTEGYDSASSIAIDATDSCYVAGHTEDYDSEIDDVILWRVTSSSSLDWVKTFNTEDEEWVPDIAVDAAGNAYLTTRNVRLLKYNSLGELQWARTWADEYTMGTSSIAVQDNSVIVGVAATLTGNWNAGVFLGDTDGGVAWGRQYLTAYDDDFFHHVLPSAANTLYIAGSGRSALGTWQDLPVTSTAATGTDAVPTGTIGYASPGTSSDIVGVLADVSGIQDTGGGEEDCTVFCLELGE